MLNQREIVLIPIPFTNLESQKRRPVVVLSNDSYNQDSQDIIVVAMTSNIEPNRKYALTLHSEDLVEGFLPVASQVRVDKIYCLHQKLILKKYGKLKEEIFSKLIGLFNQVVKNNKCEE